MASGKLLEHDEASSTFAIPAQLRAVVEKTHELVTACDVCSAVELRHRLLEVYKHGGGISWGEHRRSAECTCKMTDDLYQRTAGLKEARRRRAGPSPRDGTECRRVPPKQSRVMMLGSV